MTSEKDYDRRIAEIEVALEQEKFVTEEELEEVKNSSFDKEMESKIKSLKYAILGLGIAIVIVICTILFFRFQQADNYSTFLNSLTNFLDSFTDDIDGTGQ